MIVGVLLIVLIGLGVTVYLIRRDDSKKKKAAAEKIERLEGAHVFKNKILKNLLNSKNKTNYKARLMEELSMEIEMLKVCVIQLKSEKLITEGPHVLTLTDFGKKYAQVYVKHLVLLPDEVPNVEDEK